MEDILNGCLESVFKGESIEACLNAYPEQASQLGPLLETGLMLMRESAAIRPDAEYKARVQYQLQAMFYARHEEAEKRTRIPVWHRKWAMAMTTVLIVLLAGIGTVAAAANALPDDALYLAKLAAEQVRVTLAFSDVDEAKLHLQFAERRAAEMTELARQGKNEKLSILAKQVADHVDEVYVVKGAWEAKGGMTKGAPAQPTPSEEVAPSPSAVPLPEAEMTIPSEEEVAGYEVDEFGEELGLVLNQSRDENLAMLRYALSKAPEEIKPAIEQAIKKLTENYDETISIIGAGTNQ